MKIELLPKDLALEVVPGLADLVRRIPCQILYDGEPLVIISPTQFMRLIAGLPGSTSVEGDHEASAPLQTDPVADEPSWNVSGAATQSLDETVEYRGQEGEEQTLHGAEATDEASVDSPYRDSADPIQMEVSHDSVDSIQMESYETTEHADEVAGDIHPTEQDDPVPEADESGENYDENYVEDHGLDLNYDDASVEAATEPGSEHFPDHQVEHDGHVVEDADEEYDANGAVASAEYQDASGTGAFDGQAAHDQSDGTEFLPQDQANDYEAQDGNVEEQNDYPGEEYEATGEPQEMPAIVLRDQRDIDFETLIAARTDLPKQVIHENIAFTMEKSLTHTQATQDENGNFYTLAGTPCTRDGRGVVILPLMNATAEAPWGRDDRTGLPLSPANLRFALIKERQAINKGRKV